MDTRRIAEVLDEMGTLLEARGEDAFRCRAYHNAAQALKALPPDLSELIASNQLGETPGLGKSMLAKVVELATTGRLESYEQLRQTTPPGLVALLRVPGLGPKKIKVLREELQIEGLADLRQAAESNQVASLKGFGTKTEAKILEGINFIESVGDRILQSTARRQIGPILDWVRAQPATIKAEACGSLRRQKATIGDLDILFASSDPAPVLDGFIHRPEVAAVLAQGPTKASVRLAEGVQCDLRGVSLTQFPFALNYFTGSKEHNIAMRRRAIARGWKLNEYSLDGPEGPLPCDSEAEIYERLGLAYIEPELREDWGEIEAAERGPLPTLVTRSDLIGTFHCHTDWSDGGATLDEMVEATRARGLTYLGIADHSRSAGYAGGLSIERVRKQWAAIDALNTKLGQTFKIFKGTECDILGDGSLDYPDEILAGFDYVVASVHSLFGLSREVMTDRVIAAVKNPYVTMLGHPTGRLLLARDGYAIDLEAVIEACSKSGTMIEINANPHRLDLDDEHCRRAKALGMLLVINPDAHSTGGLDDLDYGIGVARRANLTAADVFNTRSSSEVEAAFARHRPV